MVDILQLPHEINDLINSYLFISIIDVKKYINRIRRRLREHLKVIIGLDLYELYKLKVKYAYHDNGDTISVFMNVYSSANIGYVQNVLPFYELFEFDKKTHYDISSNFICCNNNLKIPRLIQHHIFAPLIDDIAEGFNEICEVNEKIYVQH